MHDVGKSTDYKCADNLRARKLPAVGRIKVDEVTVAAIQILKSFFFLSFPSSVDSHQQEILNAAEHSAGHLIPNFHQRLGVGFRFSSQQF